MGMRTSLKYIAEEIDSPEAFTAKILQKLVRVKIIESSKGVNGGFNMASDRIKSTSVLDIVYAIDGYDICNRCVLGLSQCSSNNPCSVHHKFRPVREDLIALMNKTTVEEMALGIKDKLAILR